MPARRCRRTAAARRRRRPAPSGWSPRRSRPAGTAAGRRARGARRAGRRCRRACGSSARPGRRGRPAPTSLSAVNTADRLRRDRPKPSATTITTSDAPAVLPATLASAARLPCASARPTMNSTLGSGDDHQDDAGEGERQQGLDGGHARTLTAADRSRTFRALIPGLAAAGSARTARSARTSRSGQFRHRERLRWQGERRRLALHRLRGEQDPARSAARRSSVTRVGAEVARPPAAAPRCSTTVRASSSTSTSTSVQPRVGQLRPAPGAARSARGSTRSSVACGSCVGLVPVELRVEERAAPRSGRAPRRRPSRARRTPPSARRARPRAAPRPGSRRRTATACGRPTPRP